MKHQRKLTLLAPIIKWFGILAIITTIVSAILMGVYAYRHRNDAEVIGVSFSQVQAERFGLDWRQAYLATMDELGFRHLRLATYWDRIEKSPGNYDFSELDYQVQEAEKRGVKIKLVVGQKVIRYPECFYPSWLDRNDSQAVADRANQFITAVVTRYRSSPAIETWQVENEFLLKTFGVCPKQNLTNSALQREVNTVRSLDTTRPVELTQSNQNGFPALGPNTEFFGFSMYRIVHNNVFGYFVYPQTGIYNWWKAALIETYRPTTVTIHELQGEAWGPKGNEDLSWEEAQKSMNPAQLRDNLAYARDTRIRTMYLWGAEWWYYLLTQQNNSQMWDTARDIVGQSQVR